MPVAEEITSHGFLASRLSDHLREMDDGSLVVEDCPVARTGFQEYAAKDLPQDSAAELGVNLSNPGASIDLYRPAEEVFAPEFLASLEGRPITDGHPPGFITPENFNRYSQGHVQNVRRGELMEDGETPVIADLVISGEPLVSRVRGKQARDISLGYDYAIRRDGDKIVQCEMKANHCAVVPKGRAGDLVAIGDEAPPAPAESPPTIVEPPSIVAPVAGVLNINKDTPTKKERKPVKSNIMHLLGLGLRARAADADTDPEELAQAAMDVGEFQKPDAEDKKAKDKKMKDAKARDGESPDDPEEDDIKDVEDRRKTKDKRKAGDSHRQRMHDALDRMLDAEGGTEEDVVEEATDTDLDELKALLGQFFSEEKAEPAHQADEFSTEELDASLGCAEPAAEDGTIEEEQLPPGAVTEDGEEVLEPDGEEELEGAADKKPARDKAKAADAAAAAVLSMLRPFVARGNDQGMKRAFNAALGSVRRGSRATVASYDAVSRMARSRDRVRAADSTVNTRSGGIDKLQAAYNTAHSGSKGVK